MPISLKNIVGSGNAVEIGEVIMMQDQPEPVVELDGMEFLKSGYVISDEEEEFPEAYRNFGYNSNNLDTWILVPAGGFATKYSVKYIGGMWVATSVMGRVFRSEDAITWTRSDGVGSNILLDSAYGNGEWAVVGNAGQVAKSSDLINWTSYQIAGYESANLTSLEYAQGIWVVTTSNGHVLSSDDLENWSSVFHGAFRLNKISFIENKWYLSSDKGLYVGMSPEELSFQDSVIGERLVLNIIMKNGVWIAVGSRGVWYGEDGFSWVKGQDIATSGSYRAFAFDGITAVMSVGAKPYVYVTQDFNEWSALSPLSEAHIYSIAEHEGTWVVGPPTDINVSFPTPLLGLQKEYRENQSVHYMRIK